MKKLISSLIIILLMLGIVTSVLSRPRNLSEYIFVVFNDEAITFKDEKPFTVGGYTYVPDYIVRDWLEVDLAWEDETKTLNISRSGVTVSAKEKTGMLLTPHIDRQMKFYRTNDVLMLPLEPVAEALGFGVAYLPEGKLLRITNGNELLSNDQIFDISTGKISAEKAALEAKLATNKKPVYLTFDDGPNKEKTPIILDILKKHNAKATFFMLDANMKKYPEIVNRMKDEGHTLGLHGVTHSKNDFYKTPWSPAIEMDAANETLKNITNEKTCFVRVPYGSSPNLTNTQYSNLKGVGYLMWDWNIDSKDSLAANVSAEEIYNNSIEGLKGKEKPILLFHDKTNIAECLDSILTYLTENGYQAMPITERYTYNWKER